MNHRRFSLRVVAALVAWAAVGAAMAHHSGAMFDQAKTVTLKGTVKEFQWVNPHCWIQLVVMDDGGAPTEWSIEMGPPGSLYRRGWRPTVIKPGDTLTVIIHPVRDGKTGGSYVSAQRVGGDPLPAG